MNAKELLTILTDLNTQGYDLNSLEIKTVSNNQLRHYKVISVEHERKRLCFYFNLQSQNY